MNKFHDITGLIPKLNILLYDKNLYDQVHMLCYNLDIDDSISYRGPWPEINSDIIKSIEILGFTEDKISQLITDKVITKTSAVFIFIYGQDRPHKLWAIQGCDLKKKMN